MSSCKRITHCIFDMDGTLLDTEKIFNEIYTDMCKEFGKEYTPDLAMKVLGTTYQKSAETIIKEAGLPISTEQFVEKLLKLDKERMGEVGLMKGAERLLCHLHKFNIPIALATSSGAEQVERKTCKHKPIFDLFCHKVCGSTDPEVKNSKPAPDIFLIAASRFHCKPKPENCLVFEDAPNGVKGAVAAGMPVIMVQASQHIPEESRKIATKVISSLEEFKPEEFGLPAFPN